MGRMPALEWRRRRRRGSINSGGGIGRKVEEGTVLVLIEGAVELVEQSAGG